MGAGILQDLVFVMVVAAVVTIVFYRLRQPVVLGYLLAGVLIGPHLLGFIRNTESIDGLAELGIIFLMFAVGLEFDLKKLRKVGAPAAIAAAIEVAVMLFVGYEVGIWLGWSMMDAIFLGAALSISSTTIIVKVLTEMGKLKEEYTELAFGILIIEDIIAIVIVALLSSFGATGSVTASLVPSTIGAVLLFVFIFIALGLVLVPRLIDAVSRFHVEEVLVITVVGLAFGAALLAHNLGFSVALGAFLMGAIIAESRAVRRVEHRIVPLRDLFTATFFVAVGMLVDPDLVREHWVAILVVTLATLAGKLVATSLGAFAVGTDGRTSFKTAFALGQIGEFSFIIAGLGLTLGVVRPELPAIAIAVSCITSVATPAMIKFGPKATDAISVRLPRWYVRAASSYTRFARRISARQHEQLPHHDRRRARHGTRMAIYAAWLCGLFIMAAYASEWLGAEVGTALSLSDNTTRAAAMGFLGLATLPLFVAFVKATEAYVFARAKASAMNPKHLAARRRSALHEPVVVSRIVGGVASTILVAAAIWIAWGVHPLAIPNLWIAIPILVGLVVIGAFAWHKLERVYVGMEKTLNELMGVDDHTLDDDRNKRLRERLPWGMDIEEVHVRPIDRAAYVSLKDLELRDRTGATVLLVERGAHVIHNPHADIPILPHDKIVLVGKRGQLDQASRYISTMEHRGREVVSREVRIPAGSPAVGQALGDLDLAHAGASMGLITRRDGSVVAPSARVRIEPDDHVTIYGPEASMERVRERLHARPPSKARIGPSG